MAKLVATEHITGTIQFWLKLFNLKMLHEDTNKILFLWATSGSIQENFSTTLNLKGTVNNVTKQNHSETLLLLQYCNDVI